MVDINLDLVIQGQLDLRIAGFIGLLNEGRQKRSEIQHWKRPRIAQSSRFLPSPSPGEEEAAEQISPDETEGDARPSSVERRFRATRTLKRAARKTRQAMSELRTSMNSEDAQGIRRARERLREAVARLSEALRRGAATASQGAYRAG
jgi:hypothetical protein